MGLGGALGSAWIMSDRRLKAGVRRVAETVYGLPLYLFRYVSDLGADRLGVMADEVVRVRPDCVVDVGGRAAVDYGRLFGWEG